MKQLVIDADKMEDEAICLLENGKVRHAERILKQLLVSDPKNITAHFQLALVYLRTKEYKRAVYHSHRTLRLNPQETNACSNLGLIYEVMGRDDLASYYYKKELSHNPNNGPTLWNIGRLYFRKQRWLLASQYLRRSFEIGDLVDAEDTVDKLGKCYRELRDVNSYVDLHRRYLQMVPNASWAAANLGFALSYAKDYRHAVQWLTRAKQLGNKKKSVSAELLRANRMIRHPTPDTITVTS